MSCRSRLAHDRWYRGFVAEAIVRFQERAFLDSSGERHAGLLAADDLADWRPAWERPLAVDYHGHTVYKAGPWSQAPVFLQQLRLLEGFDLAAMGHASAEYVHTVTECAKLAFADREAWYGDPEFVDVPMETLLSRRTPTSGGRSSARRRPRSCARARRTGASRGSPSAGAGGTRRSRRRQSGEPTRAATPSTSTSSTAGETWSRRRRAAAGSGVRP